MGDFISTFTQAAVSGVPLFLVVFVIVEVMKKLTQPDGTALITGNGLMIGSFAWGVLLGMGYMVFQTRPPQVADWYAIYVYWFAALMYGIALGGAASIFYDRVKSLVVGVLSKYVESTNANPK